jgi:hypothetical protein
LIAKGKRGGKREGSGRKPKSEEKALLERLHPMADSAFRQLETAIKSGEQWAVKLWFEYSYGKPQQFVDHTTRGKTIRITLPRPDDK